jgi:polyhydroxybutyrate depolymerase
MIRSSFLCLVVLLIISCSKNDGTDNTPQADKPSEQKTISLTIDGKSRSFLLYLPSGYNNAGKMPMILALHGGMGTGEGMMTLANFKTIADRDKVVVVYPDGIANSWNDGRPTDANQQGVDDVNFFNRLCDYMITNYSVEGTKIYATGMSNGGFMSSRLGCELSSRISAIAVVGASIEANTIFSACNPGVPVPAIYIHGTNDGFVPFSGGQLTVSGSAGGFAVSHFQAVNKWVTLNNCSTTPVITDLPDIANDGTTIRERKYINTTNGVEVVSYVVTGGGHTWPQGFQYLPETIIGKTSQDMNACEVIWTFFKKYKR